MQSKNYRVRLCSLQVLFTQSCNGNPVSINKPNSEHALFHHCYDMRTGELVIHEMAFLVSHFMFYFILIIYEIEKNVQSDEVSHKCVHNRY